LLIVTVYTVVKYVMMMMMICFRLHSQWHSTCSGRGYSYELRVEARTSGAFTVTRTSTNLYNLVAIKNLVKTVKYLQFVA